jgi:hypothetical protein
MPTQETVQEALHWLGFRAVGEPGLNNWYVEPPTPVEPIGPANFAKRLGPSQRFEHPKMPGEGSLYLAGEADAVLVANGVYLARLRQHKVAASGSCTRTNPPEPAFRGDAVWLALLALIRPV